MTAAIRSRTPTGAERGRDHILLGVAELDSATAELAKAFGVTPVYGGKHPSSGKYIATWLRSRFVRDRITSSIPAARAGLEAQPASSRHRSSRPVVLLDSHLSQGPHFLPKRIAPVIL